MCPFKEQCAPLHGGRGGKIIGPGLILLVPLVPLVTNQHPHTLNLTRLWFSSLQDVSAEADDRIRCILCIVGFKEEMQSRDARVMRGEALAR